MKFISILLLIAAACASTFAQQGATSPKAASELLASSERIVKGAPFSAEAVSESLQVLADGNRIFRTSTNRMFRDSLGRFRREGIANPGTAFGAYFEMQPTILILDPVNGFKYYLNIDSKTARKYTLRIPRVVTTVGGTFFSYNKTTTSTGQGSGTGGGQSGATAPAASQAEADAAATARKSREDYVRAAEAYPRAGEAAKVELDRLKTMKVMKGHTLGEGTPFTVFENAAMSGLGYKTEAKVEALGTRNIEGVEAEGTRTTTTIPAGAIGNERPIDIVYERWYSKDLEMIISSRHTDPRFGDQTYKLVNILRTDPEINLFTLPADFKLLSEVRGTVNVAVPKPPTPSAAPGVTLSTPKPPAKITTTPAKPSQPVPASPKPVI